ncbi:MAG: TlyA family RNA methyltransferase [Actinomycetaceae bacterium]|nr:TlyA family RNA methyltransferase [Actinomycetaceae bacterium]
MVRFRRVDAELVRRKMAPSRTQALHLIREGKVFYNGEQVLKASRNIEPSGALVVKDAGQQYVSRGAYKLLGAFDYLGDNAPIVDGRICLDAGASTGGFTDVLLRKGASMVYAVDVGYGQLAWKLREDARVKVIERTNIRTLDPNLVFPPARLVVGDLSFISLTLLIPPLIKAADSHADFLLMVKPQFEVGKEHIGAKGVVRDTVWHKYAIKKVVTCACEHGLSLHAVAPSPLPGPAGNVEYFIYMNADSDNVIHDIDMAIEQAILDGPAN